MSVAFRAILRLLLENLYDESGAIRALVFGVLTEMLKQERLIGDFQAFTELIILKVLEAHRDDEKDVRKRISPVSPRWPLKHSLSVFQVERAAECCAGAMAAVLPADLVVRVLNPCRQAMKTSLLVGCSAALVSILTAAWLTG